MSEKDTLILAIESSCDETAASVVKNGRCVLSNIISSQIAIHTLYGGVVPEIASRKHIEKINQVVEAALKEADVTLDDIDAIGVTYGPGLVGALLVGVAEAKAIAYAKKYARGLQEALGREKAMEKSLIVCLSGRGDKDVNTIADYLDGKGYLN